MTYSELLEMLEIDDASGFSNFEEFAGILECEESIDYEDMKKLLSTVDEDVLMELTKSYFDEIAESLPDSATESGVFLEIMVRMLVEKLYENKEEFIEELFKFRRWYLLDSEVEIKGEDTTIVCSFFNAIAEFRADKLMGVSDITYKFDDALNYKIDD